MTADEINVLELLREAWHEFQKLPDPHPSDHAEFAQHLHILQRQVLAREGRRSLGISWTVDN